MDEAKLPPNVSHIITFTRKNDDTRIGYGMISLYNENKKDQIVVLERLDIYASYQNNIHLFYSILNGIISNAKLLKNHDEMLNQLFSSTVLIYLNNKTADAKIIKSLESKNFKFEYYGMKKDTTQYQFKNGVVINLLPKDNFHSSFLVINKTTVKKEVKPKSISNKKKKLNNDDALPDTIEELESLEYDLNENINAKYTDITKYGERIDISNQKHIDKFIKTQATQLDQYQKKLDSDKRKTLKSRQDEINKIEKQLNDITIKKQQLKDFELLRGDTQTIDDNSTDDEQYDATNNPPNILTNDDDNTDLHHKTPKKVVDDDVKQKVDTLEKSMNDMKESIEKNSINTNNMFKQIMSKFDTKTESVTTNINTDTDTNINIVKEKEVAYMDSDDDNDDLKTKKQVDKKDKKEKKEEI